MKRNLKHEIIDVLEEMRPELIRLSDTLYQHPELGHQEFRAMEWLTTVLEKYGFTVERGICGMATAFRATYRGKGEGPAVALLAEYDALPELGHACGHNLIGTASVGAAIALRQVLPDLPGKLVVLGTPAEETSGGKVVMVEQGVFRKIDAAMMVHPAGYYAVRTDSLAMDALEFVFTALEESGEEPFVSGALAGIIFLFNSLNALRQHLPEEARLHGIIVEGGHDPDCLPYQTVARFYLRARERRVLNRILAQVKKCGEAAAAASRTAVSIRKFEASYDQMRYNEYLASLFEDNLRLLGIEEIIPFESGMGSLDMGNVSQVVPAIHPYIGVGEPGLPVHTREFALATIGPGGHQALLTGAKALAMTALDLFVEPAHLCKIREEFAAKQQKDPLEG